MKRTKKQDALNITSDMLFIMIISSMVGIGFYTFLSGFPFEIRIFLSGMTTSAMTLIMLP